MSLGVGVALTNARQKALGRSAIQAAGHRIADLRQRRNNCEQAEDNHKNRTQHLIFPISS
jgi:hypothetical protein